MRRFIMSLYLTVVKGGDAMNKTESIKEYSEHVRGKGRKFERIRRIQVTGYLVGTVDRWGTGKQAELRDRVPHQTISNDITNSKLNLNLKDLM